MAGQDNAIYRGFYDSPHIQERLRLYAQESKVFQLLALRQVNPLSILTVISEKFGTVGADMVTDWVFRYQEFDELPYSTTVNGNSTPTANSLIDYIKVPNNFASSLNLNHRLLSLGTFTAVDLSGGASSSNVTTTFSPSTPLYEELKILGIGDPDSGYDGKAGETGYTWLKIKRAFPAMGCSGTLPAIANGTGLRLVNSVARTNQRPNPPVGANGKYLENVIQITRESYGVGEHMAQGGGIKTLLMNDGNAMLDLNYQLCELRFMKTIERAILTGRKSMVTVGNESEYETGGILEFIPQSNYINVNGVYNISKINDVVAQALDKSGVRELWWFGGSTHTKALAAAFENKRGFGENTELSVRYSLKVYSIEGTGRDGIIHYVNAPILSEIGMDDQSIILNLTEYNYGEKSKYGAFQIAEKVPVKDEPSDADSYESNTGFKGKWRELYYAWGLIRRLPETHFRVYGVIV